MMLIKFVIIMTADGVCKSAVHLYSYCIATAYDLTETVRSKGTGIIEISED